MIITPERFWQGYSWQQYLERIRRNRELFEKSYDSVELIDEEMTWLQRFKPNICARYWRRLVPGCVWQFSGRRADSFK